MALAPFIHVFSFVCADQESFCTVCLCSHRSFPVNLFYTRPQGVEGQSLLFMILARHFSGTGFWSLLFQGMTAISAALGDITVKFGREGGRHCIKERWDLSSSSSISSTGQCCIGELITWDVHGGHPACSPSQEHAYRWKPGDSVVMFSDNISGEN